MSDAATLARGLSRNREIVRPAGDAGGGLQNRQRRAQRRVPHRVPCRVRILGDGVVVGQTVNLSADGVSVQVSRDVPIGARVEVLIPSLAGNALHVGGRVVRTRRVTAESHELGIALSRTNVAPGAAPGADDRPRA